MPSLVKYLDDLFRWSGPVVVPGSRADSERDSADLDHSRGLDRIL